MVRRRLRQASIRSLAGNRSFRATGITNYLKNGGKLELAQQMAAMPVRGPRPYMTGAATRFHSTRSDAIPIELWLRLIDSLSTTATDRANGCRSGVGRRIVVYLFSPKVRY